MGVCRHLLAKVVIQTCDKVEILRNTKTSYVELHFWYVLWVHLYFKTLRENSW